MVPTRRLALTGAAEVITCAQSAPDLVGRIAGASVLIEDGRIRAVGRVDVPADAHELDVTGQVVMPGFVDCHTHVVFGGTRVDEYVATVAGEEPHASVPAGIVGTMGETRRRTVEELCTEAAPRLAEMLRHGTTTAESKSGYGLDPAAELRMLEANRQLQGETPVTVLSTYLGAHAFPPDCARAMYVEQVLNAIPTVAERGLAEFCDAYCDDGYFTLPETHRILAAGARHGLRPKLHLDAYSHTGAAKVGIEVDAVSVDHLNYTPASELEALAEAGVVGVAMPCLEFTVGHPRPLDLRAVVNRGMRLALATDFCPGCWVASMQLVVQLGCRLGGLSVGHALRAATIDAAAAVGLDHDRGSIEPGKRADVLVLDVSRHEELAYRVGHNAVDRVIKDGRVVVGACP